MYHTNTNAKAGRHAHIHPKRGVSYDSSRCSAPTYAFSQAAVAYLRFAVFSVKLSTPPLSPTSGRSNGNIVIISRQAKNLLKTIWHNNTKQLTAFACVYLCVRAYNMAVSVSVPVCVWLCACSVCAFEHILFRALPLCLRKFLSICHN